MPPVETICVSSGGIHDRLDKRNRSSLWPKRPTNSPDADGAGKLTSRLSSVGQRSDAGASSWRPSKSAGPVARPERRCNGSSSGSPRPVQAGAVGGSPTRADRRPSDPRTTPTPVGGGRSQAGRAGGLIGGRHDGDSIGRRTVPSRFGSLIDLWDMARMISNSGPTIKPSGDGSGRGNSPGRFSDAEAGPIGIRPTFNSSDVNGSVASGPKWERPSELAIPTASGDSLGCNPNRKANRHGF